MTTIIKKIRRTQVDILQSSHFYTNIYAGAAGRLLGIPCIGAVRNDLTSELAANGMFGKWQLRLPGHIIANSNLAISRAENLGVKRLRLHFLPNVVELESSNRHGRSVEDAVTHLVFVGRLVRQKNPELFVRLAARLVRDLPKSGLTFEVAGDGHLRAKLEQMISESGFSAKQFVLSGTATNIDTVYRRADIIVLTSDHEGTPNVVLEAMARGIPVIATNVGGVKEIVDHECGYLVQQGDLEELVTASAKLVRDPVLRRRLGENGRKYVCEYNSPSDLGKKLLKIYAKLTGGDQKNA